MDIDEEIKQIGINDAKIFIDEVKKNKDNFVNEIIQNESSGKKTHIHLESLIDKNFTEYECKNIVKLIDKEIEKIMKFKKFSIKVICCQIKDYYYTPTLEIKKKLIYLFD